MYKWIRKTHGERDFIGLREKKEDGSLGEYKFNTYEEVLVETDHFGQGVADLDLCPSINEFRDFHCRFLCIFAPNSKEWMVMEIGAMMHGLTIVPLYDTLGPESIGYVLN